MPDKPDVEPVVADLRKWREQILADAHIDVKVKLSDRGGREPVYVRYAPVEFTQLQPAIDAAEAAKDAPGLLAANVELLVKACRGVCIKRGDGSKVGIDGTVNPDEWPRFDSRLAKMFGLPEDTSGRLVCQQLFLADGDILAHAQEVSAFSGMTAAETDEELAGK